jgi:anion-transporting  ArsA/GET3 family ATPase
VVIERGFKTPLLDFPPNDGPGKPNRDITMFWPTVGCQDFLFPATLVDLAGREIPIRIPMYFISVSVAYTDPSWVTTISKLCGDSGITQQPTGWMPGMSLDDARKFYNEDSECRNVININNTVAYASARTSGDTSFETQQQTLRVEQTVYTATDDGIEFFRRNKLPAHPSVALATCRVAAVEQLTGVNEPVKALYFSSYLQKGFDAGSNSGEVYLKFATGVPMNFSGTSNVADRSGGVITPNASLVGLSRKSGPVGGSSTANVTESSLSISARGEFNPEEYFRGALEAARLLGGVLLTDVLKAVTGDLASGLGGAPKILRRLYAFGADKFLTAAKIAQAALATLFAKVQNTPGGGFRRRFEPLLDRLAVDISTLESIPAQPEDGDLTLDALESIQKSIQLQERVVADFRSIVDTATALANNPRQLAEEELGAWLDQLESQFFQLSSVNDAINALVTVLIKIDDTQNLVGRLLVDAQNKLIDDLTSEVASGIVAPIAQRAISGAILIGKRVQQKFAEAGGWNAAEKAVEKGLTIAADAAQAVEELRAALRLISDLLDAASRDPGGFVVAVLHLTGLDQIPEITKILDWRARAEVAYQAVLDTIQADTDRAANLTRLWIRFRSIHVRIETEFKSLRAEVQRMVQSPSDPSYRAAVVQRLGRVQALQREFAAAVLEFDQFLHTLIEAIATARVRRNVAVDLSALAGEVDVLRQLLLEGIHSFALVTAATVAGIKQNLRDAWGAMTIPMTTIGDRIGAVFTNYQQKLIASLDVLPSNPGIDDIPKFVDVINAATDASSFFSLFGEVENAAAALKMRMRTIRADLDSAMALAKTLYPGVRTLNDKLLAVANAAPALLKQALVNEVNKAARPLSDALTAYTNDRLDELASLLSQVLAILFSALTEVLSRVEPTLDGLLDLLATATEIRKQLAELLAVRRIEVSFAWTPEMKAGPADLAIFEPRDPVEDEDPELPHCQIDSRIQIMLPSGERRASLVGTLRRFNLNLLTKSTHFITVDFHSLQFRSVNGSAPDCKVDIHEVRFGGDLSFLDSIRKYLSPDQGPFLEFRDNAIVAGFRFALPPIDTGGMTIRDARLEFAISIPFNGEPVRFRFGLSRKSDPFVVAITLMGGGGWFALGIGADGVDLIDIGIEAGLAGSISVGPVSGFGRIMVGVFLRKDASKGTTLGGFVDIFGKVSVIGISVTLIANLTLSYNFQARLAEGDVEVIIRISLWLVDIEFRFHVHREFSTSGGATGILTRPSVKGFSAIPGADLVDEPRVGARNVVHEMNWPVYEEALMEL